MRKVSGYVLLVILGLQVNLWTMAVVDDAALAKAQGFMSTKAWQRAVEQFAIAEAASALESGPTYDYACALALSGDVDQAMKVLKLAVQRGFTNARHIASDSDLTGLHGHPDWEGLVQSAADKQAESEKIYAGMALRTPYQSQLSEEVRIAGLSFFWSEVKYNFINFDLVPELDWDALYLEYLPKVRAAQDTEAYYLTLASFCAQLRDGHTNIFPPSELRDRFYARPPVRTKLLGDRVLIVELQEPSMAELGLEVGMEITAIDGEPVQAFAARVKAPYVCASTPQDRANRIFNYGLLAGDSQKPLVLTVLDAKNQERQFTLKRVAPNDRGNWAVHPSFAWRMVAGDIAYVLLEEFGSDEASKQFMAQFEEIAKAKAIIFDVRNNGGGNSGVGWDILGCLTKTPFATTAWSTRKYVPTYRAWGRVPGSEGNTGEDWPANGGHYYAGPVVVLTSAVTYSAAEDFTGVFKQMKRGTIIGEPTGGSTGQPLQITLPGGITGRICTKRDRLADGTEFVGRGLQPDILVAPTVAGLRAGKDEVLEAAISYLSR